MPSSFTYFLLILLSGIMICRATPLAPNGLFVREIRAPLLVPASSSSFGGFYTSPGSGSDCGDYKGYTNVYTLDRTCPGGPKTASGTYSTIYQNYDSATGDYCLNELTLCSTGKDANFGGILTYYSSHQPQIGGAEALSCGSHYGAGVKFELLARESSALTVEESVFLHFCYSFAYNKGDEIGGFFSNCTNCNVDALHSIVSVRNPETSNFSCSSGYSATVFLDAISPLKLCNGGYCKVKLSFCRKTGAASASEQARNDLVDENGMPLVNPTCPCMNKKNKKLMLDLMMMTITKQQQQ